MKIKMRTYPKNITAKHDLIPYWANTSVQISGNEIYDKLIEIYPQHIAQIQSLKNSTPKSILECWYGYYHTFNSNRAVMSAERWLGIDIDPHYILPNNMSYRDYEMYVLRCYDLAMSVLSDSALDDVQSDNFYGITAYMQIWLLLQYNDLTDTLTPHEIPKKIANIKSHISDWLHTQLMAEWTKLCDLNPQLSGINFNQNNLQKQYDALRGVASGFPAADIELYLTEPRTKAAVFARNAKLLELKKQSHLPNFFKFGWVLSPKTIEDLSQKYSTQTLMGRISRIFSNNK